MKTVVLKMDLETDIAGKSTCIDAVVQYTFQFGKSINRLTEKSQSKKEGAFSLFRLVFTCSCLVSVAALCGGVPLPNRHFPPVQIELRSPNRVFSLAEGRLVEMFVSPGQYVSKGQTIARLENAEVEAQIRQLTVEKNVLESQIEYLNLTKQHAQHSLARQELFSVTRRIDELIPLQESLTIKASVSGKVVGGDFRPSQRTSIGGLSGWAGSLLDPCNVGAMVEAGTLITSIEENDELVAILYLEQSTVEQLRRDQAVRVRMDAYPHRLFEGTITSVAVSQSTSIPAALSQRMGGRLPSRPESDGSEKVIRPVFRVEVSLSASEAILPGMRGRARVILNELTFLQWAQRTIRNTFYFRF